MDAPNRNLLWSRILVDELSRAGLQAVCIAPGSRSTPLTIAFAEHPKIKVYSHLDERSAAYFALGMAQAEDRPVAMVCTSGTAAANFYPAIIEAKQSQIPLLVLTADRPAELRDSGANQTIDQVKMYGDNVLWSVEVAPPEANPPALTIRYLRTLASRAFARANGIVKGAVHLNIPFRKPLEPIPVESDHASVPVGAMGRDHEMPFTRISRGIVQPDHDDLAYLEGIIRQHERGLIVCGPNTSRSKGFPGTVAWLSRTTGYPIIADPLSNIRFHNYGHPPVIIAGYDTFINQMDFSSPDVVINFGAVPTSNALNTYLGGINPQYRFLINESGVWSNDLYHLTDFMQTEPIMFCDELAENLSDLNERQSTWLEQFRMTEEIHWQAMNGVLDEEFFDGVVLHDVIQSAPEGSTLFIGNSLPVRHLDQFGKPVQKHIRVLGNRGASGIDGVISSALGAATSSERLILVIGDVSFYHDMNGLLAIKRCGIQNVTIVLLNNNGGGIFNRLPIAQFDPPFTEHFLTPHGLNFEPVIRMYGLEYARVDTREDFAQAFENSLNDNRPHVIEVRTDGQHDHQRRLAVMEFVNRQIKQEMESLSS